MFFVWTEPSAGPFSVNYCKCDYVCLYIICNDTKKGLYIKKSRRFVNTARIQSTTIITNSGVVIVAQEYCDYMVSVAVFNSNDHRYVNVLACHRIDSITDVNIMVGPGSR